ncbi:MAG TPA: type 2 lanthipeptide synthetase LanM family protein, partial [Ktedonobacteraceae bacterium]|nr:type 2 lanthipeptide synthetase LanM family protein [Ktedonobacteraceae bacterium]
ICATFTPEHDPGLLLDVQGNMGDPHRKGRSVLTVRFHSGLQLLYKPRSLAIDAHFQELLEWLNKQDVQPAFRTIGIINRGSHGWSEFVRAQSCTSRKEVERFYERQGSYLALLYALNATDMHVENVIASGEHPILVDLEALFHPRVGGNDPTQPYNPGMQAMDQSVFRVGLLPHRIWSNQEGSGVDLSGFGGQAGQMTPYPLPRWEAARTDQMRLVRQPAQIPVKQNRPQLNGNDVDILDYRQQIIASFTRMYRFLQAQTQRQPSELISNILPRFAHDEVRLLLRPSQRYATLLTEGFHPDLLRDALARDRFFDQLWREVELRPYLSKVIVAECRDLQRGDIPIFTTYPDCCTIFTSDGQALHDFFDEPGIQLVEQRLSSLDEQDLARQRWIVEAALATLLIGSEGISRKVLQVSPTPSPVTREGLIANACAVGDRLDRLATRSEYGASWLGVSVVNESAWSLLPTDIDLYSGTSGIGLFLGYLGAITGETRYTELARLALTSVLHQIEQQKKNLKWANVGVFDGLGSAIYLLVHLSVLWQDLSLLRSAEAIVELLPALITKDERLDIIGGCAGCILNLLSFYRIYPSVKILAVARQCGDRLLATAQYMSQGAECAAAWVTVKHERPLGGFAHGTAGIALSLSKLAEISGDERYRQTAEAALAYDRSLFLPEQQNWADLRTMPSQLTSTRSNEQDGGQNSTASRSSMVAWCHGAAGVGLSRMAMLTSFDNTTARKEIEIALQAIIDARLTDNHSLCHGALGNVDTLLMATQLLDEVYYREPLERMKAMIVDSIAASGWVTGVPFAVETPGLMSGLAGIGYELLRLAEPEKVPSVLLLSPPPAF